MNSNSLTRFFPGNSETALKMRAVDWCQTSLGTPDGWPVSLVSALGTCLNSRFPMQILWGPGLCAFANDAYFSFFPAKEHSSFLSLTARELWAEEWKTVEPIISRVFSEGLSQDSEEIKLLVNRQTKSEEAHLTFSFSPIFAEDSEVAGVICTFVEHTQEVIANRRLETLQKLVTVDINKSDATNCEAAMGVLAQNQQDVPFAALYEIDQSTNCATLTQLVGRSVLEGSLPDKIELNKDFYSFWPIQLVIKSMQAETISQGDEIASTKLTSSWYQHKQSARILALGSSTSQPLAGLMILGINPNRPFDQSYSAFFDSIAEHFAALLINERIFIGQQDQIQQLSLLEKNKTEFFSNISHEFKTPLTLILNSIDEEIQAQSHSSQWLQSAKSNCMRLLKLANNLIDFSRIEEGRSSLNFVPTDIASLTRDLANVFRSAIKRTGLSLVIDCPTIAVDVYVDRDMWETIVLNLISNSLKFTFEGEIRIELSYSKQRVELTISDTGIGISNADLPYLFDRFNRVRGARSRTNEGSGLGLALVKELVTCHGGDIRVQSKEGVGTSFIVSIPTGYDHLPKEKIGTDSSYRISELSTYFAQDELSWDTNYPDFNDTYEYSPSNPSILVVDDNLEMAQYLRKLLASEYKVFLASNGNEALVTMREHKPNLVISDIMMPGVDGFSLLEQIRSEEELSLTPVILLSARASETAKIEGFTHTANDYVVIPFQTRELLARVKAQLDISKLRQQVEQKLHDVQSNLEQKIVDLSIEIEQSKKRLNSEITTRGNLESEFAIREDKKNQFLCTLANQLKTPLSSLTAGLQLIASNKQDPQLLNIMSRQLELLARLFDDLLDSSAITKETLSLHKEKIEVETLIDRAVETSMASISAGNHYIEVLPTDDMIYVEADTHRMVQVISSLLMIASKHSPNASQITISIQLKVDIVQIKTKFDEEAIQESGLAKGSNSTIEEELSQNQRRVELDAELHLAKKLVELHSGSIEVKFGDRGQESEFIINLPVLQQIAKSAIDFQPLDFLPNGFNRSILVVDDNYEAAKLLSSQLEKLGNRVYTVQKGENALDVARRFKPEIAFLDIGRPQSNGYSLAEQIRRDRSISHAVLVAQTDSNQSANVDVFSKAGFDLHLVKPLNAEAVKTILLDTVFVGEASSLAN